MSEQAPNTRKPGTPRTQPALLSLWLRRLVYSLLTLTVLVLLAVGAAVYVIEQKGGPAAYISARVSEALPGAFKTKIDNSFGMRRIEYHCANCGAHHGHVFEDGPTESRKRFCNNGLCLIFKPE